MKPMQLSPVNIVLPTYYGGKAVAVSGYLAGAEISIFRYPALGGRVQQIGKAIAPMAEKLCNIEVDDLNYNDRVFAIQTYSLPTECLSSLEPTNIPSTKGPRNPMLVPYICTPLYACARGITVGNIVNGAMVEVFVNDQSVFKGPIGCPNLLIGISPLEPGDQVYATQLMPQTSPFPSKSPVETVVPYPERQLPHPKIRKPLIECAPSFEVEGLVPGAQLSIYEENQAQPIAVKVVSDLVTSIEVEGKLQKDWVLSADQELCGEMDRSPRSDKEPVEDIESFGTLPEHLPWIQLPIKPGDTFIVVHGVHESTIRILANDKDIGGGTCYGITAFNLEPPLPDAEIKLIQSFDCREREWEVESQPVKSVPNDQVVEWDDLDTLQTMIKQMPLPIMIEFYATWCSVCYEIQGWMDKLAKDYAGRAIIARIDQDKLNPYGIDAFPTFMFFKNGLNVGTYQGWNDQLLLALLNALVGP